MLQAPVPPSSYSLRGRRTKKDRQSVADAVEGPMADAYEDDDGGDASGGKGRTKSRRELPAGAVATLKAWLLSPEHFTHPYPTPQDQAMLMQKTGIDKKQLKNWFTNARRRIWKPMLKKQIEQGKLSATGAPGVPGAVPGLMIPTIPGAAGQQANASMENPHSIQAMRAHYQQAVQQQQQDQQVRNTAHSCSRLSAVRHPHAYSSLQQTQQDSFGNPVYASAPTSDQQSSQYYVSHPGDPNNTQGSQLPSINSIGTLPQTSSGVNLSKTDSHAVLMELFARDQDLVRQATESARLKAESRQQGGVPGQAQQQPPSQHPMKAPTQSSTLPNVPTLNSWPHFSSINSLNNLGTIPGVKSITSLSGADLAGKGNLGGNKGNLAQVKSQESMGKNDSYAFLEVFFGDRSATNLSGMGGKDSKGMKQTGEEDNEIGLSLEDESPSHTTAKKDFPIPAPASAAPQPAPMTTIAQDSSLESGTLKRAYDDALAARGLISVSRSSEKLTDLVLPAKIQRTLSQEFISKQQAQSQAQAQGQTKPAYGQFAYTPAPAPAPSPDGDQASSHQQYPGQQPVEPQSSEFSGESSETDGHVKVSTSTTCAICNQTNVDTQLRPCGHMFHERCLKPSLQTAMGQPKCPIDDVPMHSAVLAIPTEDYVQKQNDSSQAQDQQQPAWNYAVPQTSVSSESPAS